MAISLKRKWKVVVYSGASTASGSGRGSWRSGIGFRVLVRSPMEKLSVSCCIARHLSAVLVVSRVQAARDRILSLIKEALSREKEHGQSLRANPVCELRGMRIANVTLEQKSSGSRMETLHFQQILFCDFHFISCPRSCKC